MHNRRNTKLKDAIIKNAIKNGVPAQFETKTDFNNRPEPTKIPTNLTAAIVKRLRLSKSENTSFDIRTIAKRKPDPSLNDVLAEHPEFSTAAPWLQLPDENHSRGIIWY